MHLCPSRLYHKLDCTPEAHKVTKSLHRTKLTPASPFPIFFILNSSEEVTQHSSTKLLIYCTNHTDLRSLTFLNVLLMLRQVFFLRRFFLDVSLDK